MLPRNPQPSGDSSSILRQFGIKTVWKRRRRPLSSGTFIPISGCTQPQLRFRAVSACCWPDRSGVYFSLNWFPRKRIQMREKYLLFPIPQNGWTDVVSIRSTTVTTTRTAPKTTLTTVVHRFRDSILLACIDCIQFPFAKGFCFRYECIFLAICVVFLVFLFRFVAEAKLAVGNLKRTSQQRSTTSTYLPSSTRT